MKNKAEESIFDKHPSEVLSNPLRLTIADSFLVWVLTNIPSLKNILPDPREELREKLINKLAQIIEDTERKPLDLSPINHLLSSPDFTLPAEFLTDDRIVEAAINNGHPKLLNFLLKAFDLLPQNNQEELNLNKTKISDILESYNQLGNHTENFFEFDHFTKFLEESYKKAEKDAFETIDTEHSKPYNDIITNIYNEKARALLSIPYSWFIAKLIEHNNQLHIDLSKHSSNSKEVELPKSTTHNPLSTPKLLTGPNNQKIQK